MPDELVREPEPGTGGEPVLGRDDRVVVCGAQGEAFGVEHVAGQLSNPNVRAGAISAQKLSGSTSTVTDCLPIAGWSNSIAAVIRYPSCGAIVYVESPSRMTNGSRTMTDSAGGPSCSAMPAC